MPPKRAASPKDYQTPKRRDDGLSPPPPPRPLDSSPSVSPASSASSDSSVTGALDRMSVRPLSPDTMGSLRAAGIPHDPTRHPNYDERRRRAYIPEDPLSAGAAVRVLPLPPRMPLPLQMRRGLSDQQLQENQALIDARNVARDSRKNWLKPNGQLVAGAVGEKV